MREGSRAEQNIIASEASNHNTWTSSGELIAKSANTPWMAGAMKRATVKSVENIAVLWGEEGEGRA